MARIASGNYDAVIVSHRSFEFLPVSDKLFNRFIDGQIDQLENAIHEAKRGNGRQPPHREGTGESQEAPRPPS